MNSGGLAPVPDEHGLMKGHVPGVSRTEIPGRTSPSPSSSRQRFAAATGSKLCGR